MYPLLIVTLRYIKDCLYIYTKISSKCNKILLCYTRNSTCSMALPRILIYSMAVINNVQIRVAVNVLMKRTSIWCSLVQLDKRSGGWYLFCVHIIAILEPKRNSGTAELWTLQDHANCPQKGSVFYTEGASNNLTTISSCCMHDLRVRNSE